MKKTYIHPTMRVATLEPHYAMLDSSPFETVPINDDEDAVFV